MEIATFNSKNGYIYFTRTYLYADQIDIASARLIAENKNSKTKNRGTDP